MKLKSFFVSRIVVALALLALGQLAYAAGSITGQGRFEKIAGVPSMGYKYLYEWDLFLSPGDNSMIGPCRRLGAPPGQPPTGDGYYRIDNLPAGTYSVYVNQPDFFASPKVVPGVQILDGQTTTVNVDLDVDYSSYFRDTGGAQWTSWQWEWFQTFLATGTSVRGISWVMAGAGAYHGKRGEISILEDNGNSNVRNWKLVATKEKQSLGNDTDLWLRWPSGEIKLTPGKYYAVKIWVQDGCAVYKRDKDGSSYPHGRAYDINGNPQNFDLTVTVFVDRNDQSVTHTRLNPGPGQFDGGLNDTRWGQTFIATGSALAAVDLFAASGDANFDLTWRVRQGGANGPQIGPTKTTQGAYFASSTDLVGVSYNPDEVSMTPGQIYCIEIIDTVEFTPYTQEPWNSFSDGAAYRNGVATSHDLAMTIMEYTPPETKTADINGDGRVNFQDYCTLSRYWLQDESSADIAPPPYGDGTVNLEDVAEFTQAWMTATTIPPLPGPASGPNPPDGATGVSRTLDLRWTAGADADSHDVYIGWSDPPPFRCNQMETRFSGGTLAPGATYYWRIDERNKWGKTQGTVWSFTTTASP